MSCDNRDTDEECTKTITIPQVYFSGGQSYSYDIEQEVSCDFPEPEDVVVIDPPELENFTYEILALNFTTDSINNTRNIEIEIQLNNNNEFDAEGIVIAVLDLGDGITSTGPFIPNLASNPCQTIDANSSCVFEAYFEESLDIVEPDFSFEIIDLKYYLTSE